MAQEFWDEQIQKREMEKVINLLKRYNIDFTIDDDKVLIMGNVKHVDICLLYTSPSPRDS